MGLLSYKRCQKVSRKNKYLHTRACKIRPKTDTFFPWSQQVIKLGLYLRHGKETALPTVKKPVISTSKTRKGSSSKNFKNMLIIFFDGLGLLYKEFIVQDTTMNKLLYMGVLRRSTGNVER